MTADRCLESLHTKFLVFQCHGFRYTIGIHHDHVVLFKFHDALFKIYFIQHAQKNPFGLE